MADLICSVENCTAPRYQRHKMCGAHYMRWYRHGRTESVADAGISLSHGRRYQRVAAPWKSHPLADRSGRGYEHRFVLFDAIGYGPHLCHWCGDAIHWRSTLHVDHLDGYGDNNDPVNLVPSCNGCNSGRAARARAEAYRSGGYWSAHDTTRTGKG